MIQSGDKDEDYRKHKVSNEASLMIIVLFPVMESSYQNTNIKKKNWRHQKKILIIILSFHVGCCLFVIRGYWWSETTEFSMCASFALVTSLPRPHSSLCNSYRAAFTLPRNFASYISNKQRFNPVFLETPTAVLNISQFFFLMVFFKVLKKRKIYSPWKAICIESYYEK